MKRVAIIAAHPDDEVLGCGGTIAKHSARGDIVDVLFFTDGESSRLNFVVSHIENRKKSALTALKLLGVKGKIEFLNYPDNALDSVRLLEITQSLEKIILPLNPSIVYTHSAVDLNLDHQLVNRSVMTCFRPIKSKMPSKIYGFEVASSTEWAINQKFNPLHFINIDQHIDTKLRALNAYASELRKSPHPRSFEYIKALATIRGGQSGCKYAEGFEILRSIG